MSDRQSRWLTVELGKLSSEMCLGKMLDKEKNRGTLQPYLRNINVRWFGFDLSDLKEMRFEEGEETRFQLERGDLVICEGGEPGRAAVWNGQVGSAKIQKALHRVRFRADEYDPSFAMYYLFYGSLINRFEPFYTGTTIKHLTGAALSRVPFPVPPLNEQRRIVAKIEELFSDLDAGVAALERVRANLKRYRAAVLKAAVEGKLTEDWRAQHPDTEPASVLLERILTERRRHWEKDQLTKFAQAGKKPPKGWETKYQEPAIPEHSPSELPDGWCWASLEQVSSSVRPITYGILKPGAFFPQGVIMLRIVDITSGVVTLEGVHRVSQSLSDEYSRTLLCGDEVLISLVGSIGLVGYFPGSTEAVNLHRNLGMIAPSPRVLGKYLWLVMSSRIVKKQIEEVATGALQPLLNLSDVRKLTVPVMSEDEQRVVVEKLEGILSSMDQIKADLDVQLRRASRLRQGILKRAFEGRLVPQDPTDEPADKLLARIREQRNATPRALNGTPGTRQRGRRRGGGSTLPLFPEGGSGRE